MFLHGDRKSSELSIHESLSWRRALNVAIAQIVLSLGEILLGSLAKPLHRFYVILHHALTILAEIAQIVFSLWEILFGSFAPPLCCFHLIVRHTKASGIAHTQFKFRLGIALFCPCFGFGQRFA